MEADWEVEIGPEEPVIDAFWPGFIDLRSAPERIREIEEANNFPALANALIRLNALVRHEPGLDSKSSIWTAKCDIWTPQNCDPYEMDATDSECATGLACYLDLLPREGLVFKGLPEAESWACLVIGRLRLLPCRSCRIDLVIRQAFAGDVEGLGVTGYIVACGVDSEAAADALTAALVVFVDALSGDLTT